MSDPIVELSNSVKDALALFEVLRDPARYQKLLGELDRCLGEIQEAAITKQEAQRLYGEAETVLREAKAARDDLDRQKAAHDQAAKAWVEGAKKQQVDFEQAKAELEERLRLVSNRDVELRAKVQALQAKESELKGREAALRQEEADYEARMIALEGLTRRAR